MIEINLKWYMTARIQHETKFHPELQKQIFDAIEQFNAGKWGKLPQEDIEANDRDLKNLEGRIIARYETSVDDIYIITEDFETALIMFCDEY